MSENNGLTQLQANIYTAWGIKPDAAFNVFGRMIHISGAVLNSSFLDTMYNRYIHAVDGYRKIFNDRGTSGFRNTLNYFDADLNGILLPIYQEIMEIFVKGGVPISIGIFRDTYCQKYYDYSALNSLMDEFNRKVEAKNRIVRRYNNSEAGGFMESFASGELLLTPDATNMANKAKTLESLAESIEGTIYSIVYRAFPQAVNDYVGKTYFYISGAEIRNEPHEQYCALGDDERTSPAALDLLLRAMQIDPDNLDIFRSLYYKQAVKGCGLDVVINYIASDEKAATRLKYRLINEWIADIDFHDREKINNYFSIFDDLCERWEMTKENMPIAYALRSWIFCLYVLEDVIFNPKLSRINGIPLNTKGIQLYDYPELIKMAKNALDDAEGQTYLDSNKFFNDALLACRELPDIIDEDSRTVLGKVYDTYEEAEAFRYQIGEVMERYRNTDYRKKEAVGEIEALINEYPYTDELAPLIAKARRAAELSVQIDAFLAEMKDRVYQTRQEFAYDMMRGRVLETQRIFLEMGRTDLDEWDAKHFKLARCAFGQMYANVYEAAIAYFNILERAWTYQAHLDEKSAATGLFKKIANTVVGFSKKEYEPDYMLVTENGTRPLPPIAENEQANVESYYNYMNSESQRLKQEYWEQFDPGAAVLAERIEAMKTSYRSIRNAEALSTLVANTADYEG